MKTNVKTLKRPVYEPFNRTQGLELVDADFQCQSEEKSVTEMSAEELCVLRDELVESIADYDTIIDLQLQGSSIGFSKESLRNDRRRRQQLIVELRAVKKQIVMMNMNQNERRVAVG